MQLAPNSMFCRSVDQGRLLLSCAFHHLLTPRCHEGTFQGLILGTATE